MREIASLRRQAETLNTPSTYAKCAKLQRLANAKEQELSALQQHGEGDARARISAAMVTIKVRFNNILEPVQPSPGACCCTPLHARVHVAQSILGAAKFPCAVRMWMFLVPHVVEDA